MLICSLRGPSDAGQVRLACDMLQVNGLNSNCLRTCAVIVSIFKEPKMFVPDVEVIVGTYEEFLLGYKTVKNEDAVS